MNPEDIQQMVKMLRSTFVNVAYGATHEAADMLESLSNKLDECQQARDSYCSAAYRAQTELAALKAERGERTKKLEAALIHIQQVACSGSPELGIAKDALK